MTSRTIPFIVDADAPPVRSSRSPLEHIVATRTSKLLDVQLTTLTAEIQQRVSDVNEVLSQIDTSGGMFDVSSVSLDLAITSTGKVALLSTIEGSASPHVGLHITLSRRKG